MNGTIERRWPAGVLLCLVLFATAGLQPAHAAKAGKKAPMCLGKRATIVGNAKGNTLRGSKKADVIFGGGGKDKIKGGGGADRICGGAAADSIQGGAGNDRIDGGGGSDTCRQNAGTGSVKACEAPTYALQVAKAGGGAGEVTSAPAGIACGGACSLSYFEGSTVALTATPAAGSVFAGWSGACSGTGACSLVLSATQSVTATFSPVGVSHPLTVQPAGSGSGTITSSPAGVSCGSDCSESYPEGTLVTLTASPAGGSIFGGWSGAGCSGAGACIVTMDAARSVTATLTLSRTLSVGQAGSGSGTVSSSPSGITCAPTCVHAYPDLESVILTASPAAGSTFTSWAGCDVPVGNQCTMTMDTNESVTATFTSITYTLSVSKFGSGTGSASSSPAGITCGEDCSQVYDEGTDVTLTATADSGSRFTGWSGEGCSGAGTCSVSMTAAKSVTAAFTKLYTLTVNKDGTGSGTVSSSPAGISCGGDCTADYDDGTSVTLTATPSGGSVFAGWAGEGCSGTGTCQVTMGGARSPTATFTAATFPMSVSRLGSGGGSITSSPAGITCGGDCAEDFGANVVVTLTATPDGSSVFTGWGGDCSGTSTTCNVTMSAARSVTGGFAVARTLTAAKDGNGSGTVTSSPAGINCGGDCTEAFADGQSVTLTAAAAAGSTFTAWAGCDSEVGNQCTVAMGTNRTATATFTLLQYTLTVDRAGLGTGSVTGSPGAINCGNTCSDTFNHGQVVTLTASAGANSAFTGWSGDCSGASTTCNVTMSAVKSVTATFARTFLLTVSKDGTGSGTVESDVSGISCGANCDEAYVESSSVVLTATPAGGSQVAGWTGGGCSGTGSTCTVTMNAAKTVTVTFNRITYALSVSKAGTGDGTVSSNPTGITCGGDCNETYDEGTSVTLTAAASAGSLFTGWSGGGCSGASATCNVTMDGAKAVTATFTDSFVLTVSKAGTGSGTVDSDIAGIDCGSDCTQEYVESTVVVLTATPAAGSTFAGWSGGGCSGTGTCSVTMNAAKNPTATFTQITHTLTASKTGSGTGSVSSSPAGIDCGGDCSQAYNQGTDVTLTATADAGSMFAGWSGGGCTGTGTCVVTMSAATTVTATFTKLYTLTVSKDGTGSGSVSSSPSGVSCGGDCSEDYLDGTVVTLTATPSAGSTFTAWTGAGCSGTGTCQVTMSAARSVTATFTQITHTLTVSTTGSGTGSVSSSPAGIDCGLDCSQSYNEGTSVTLTATPGGGSVFSGWSGGGCSGTGSCVVTMDGAKSVTADFTAGRTLTVQKDGSGSGTATSSPAGISCGEDCSEGYLHGATVTLTAGASAGSVFTSWTNCDSPSGSTCEMSMTADKTVTATFTALFTLTVATDGTGEGSVSSSPAGITCGVDCTEDYVDGTSVTLTATPSAGSTFTGWSGAGCSGTGTCVVTMNAAKSVTATFKLLFTLTVTLGGTQLGAVTSDIAGITCPDDCTQDYADGTVVILTADPDPLHVFQGWSGSGCTGTGTCTVTMSQAHNVTATFV